MAAAVFSWPGYVTVMAVVAPPVSTPPLSESTSVAVLAATSSPTPIPSPSVAPLSTVLPIPTPTTTIPVSPSPTAVPAPTLTPTTAPSPTPVPAPHLRHLTEKQYMLNLINLERERAGVPPVELGTNSAAQLHAESSLTNCYSSHWGMDGLKPYQRYSLAGGYQSNAENGLGLDYCIRPGSGYRPSTGINGEIREAVDSWMTSAGHRRNLLDPFHRKVNIGLSWDQYNQMMYQHFEGNHVDYASPPSLIDGILRLSGTSKNGVYFNAPDELGVQIYFDPPPHTLTLGQLSRTYCYDFGLLVASLNWPLPSNSFWPITEDEVIISTCPDPYAVPVTAQAPISPYEARRFWEQAKNAGSTSKRVVMQWVTASEWTASGQKFSLKVSISKLLEKHGGGIYTVVVWANMEDGKKGIISMMSFWHDVEPPDTYSPNQWGLYSGF